MENYDYKKREINSVPVKAEKPKLEDFFKWSMDKRKLKYVFFNIKTPPEESILAVIIIKKLYTLLSKYNAKFNSVIETFHPEVLSKMKAEYTSLNYSLDEEPNFGLILRPWKFSGVKTAVQYGNKYAIAFRPRKVTIANWTI